MQYMHLGDWEVGPLTYKTVDRLICKPCLYSRSVVSTGNPCSYRVVDIGRLHSGQRVASSHLRAVEEEHKLRRLDLLLKCLGLVESSWEAVDEELVVAAALHGLPEQLHSDLRGHQLPILHETLHLLAQGCTLLHLHPTPYRAWLRAREAHALSVAARQQSELASQAAAPAHSRDILHHVCSGSHAPSLTGWQDSTVFSSKAMPHLCPEQITS